VRASAEDPELRQLRDGVELLIRLVEHEHQSVVVRAWDNLTPRDQRLIVGELLAMVATLRAERRRSGE
jgi:hypothetical protein